MADFDFDFLEELDPTHLQVHLVTPGGGLAASIHLPKDATVAVLKAEVARCLAYRTPDQRLLVGTRVLDSRDELLWDYVDKATRVLEVTVLRVTGATRMAASFTLGGVLKLWDLKEYEEIAELKTLQGEVTCAAMDRRAERALVAGEDGAMQLWDLLRGQAIREFRGHTSRVNALAVDWQEGQALSGGADGAVRFWDLDLGQARHVLRTHWADTSQVLCVALDAKREMAASGYVSRMLRFWDLRSATCVREIDEHFADVACVQADFAGGYAITASLKDVRVWKLHDCTCCNNLLGHDGKVTCLAVHWPSRRILSGGDTTLRLWLPLDNAQVTDYDFERIFVCGHVFRARQEVYSLAVDWDAGQAICGGHRGIQLWDLGGDFLAQIGSSGVGGVLCLAGSEGPCEERDEAPAD